MSDTIAGTPVNARRLWLNGEETRSGAATLQALLVELGFDPAHKAFACAVNGMFVPRAAWQRQALQDDDRIDIVAPVVGG